MFLSKRHRRTVAAALAVAIGLALVLLTDGLRPTPPAPPGPPPVRTLDTSTMSAIGELKARDWNMVGRSRWVTMIPINPVALPQSIGQFPTRLPPQAVVSAKDVSVPAGKDLMLEVRRFRMPRRPTIWTKLLGVVGIKPSEKVPLDLSFLRGLAPGDLQGLAVVPGPDANPVVFKKNWYRRNIGPLRWLRILVLSGNRLSEYGLDFLDDLTSLEELDLSLNGLKDDDLTHLAKLTSLRRLNLAGNPVGGRGPAHLKDLKSLEELNLSGTNVTDGGAVHLSNLASLRSLNLHFTPITDDALPFIGKLKSLVELNLDCDVAGPGLVHLAKLASLQRLALWSISDPADLAALADLPSLEELDLGITEMTDEHVEVLKTFPSLRRLRLRRSFVGAPMRAKLKAALPGCRITW